MCASISTLGGAAFCGKHASPRKIHHPQRISMADQKNSPTRTLEIERLTLHSFGAFNLSAAIFAAQFSTAWAAIRSRPSVTPQLSHAECRAAYSL